MLSSIQVSGLNSSPVGTFGKKYVDLGGMLTPVAAISWTCRTGLGRRKNARSTFAVEDQRNRLVVGAGVRQAVLVVDVVVGELAAGP